MEVMLARSIYLAPIYSDWPKSQPSSSTRFLCELVREVAEDLGNEVTVTTRDTEINECINR